MDARLTDTSTWMRERIDGRIAVGLGITWLVLFEVAAALEPATNQPEPIYGVALELTMWLLLAAMVTGLVMQRRAGLVASLGAAGFLTALSVACPLSGHHPFGAWWFGQMACVLGLVAASVVALHWSSDAPDAPDDSPRTGSDAQHRLDAMTEREQPLPPAERAQLQ